MEHLQDINGTWQRLSEILRDKGVLVIAVPNPASFDAEHYKEVWAAYDVPRHLWHFTPSAMQQFGAKFGFILTERIRCRLTRFMFRCFRKSTGEAVCLS